MEEYTITNEPKKSFPILLLLILPLFIILIASIGLFYFTHPGLIDKGTAPESLLNNTHPILSIKSAPFMLYEEYYNELNSKEEKKSYNSKDYDFTTPRYEYDYDFYNHDDGYYDRCQGKKVEINLSNQKISKFSFNYLEKEFEIKVNLYSDLYKFTDELKNQDCYFEKDKYALGYLDDPYNNYFIQSLTKQFINLKSEYTDDQIVEIATVFAQSIPYGTDPTDLNRYPYETLYEGQGNCLDKSIILIGILKELGYTTYIILGDTGEYHALPGIVCEKGNIEYEGNEICFMETTIYSPIGSSSEIEIEKLVKTSTGTRVYSGSDYGPALVKFFNITKQEIKNIEENIELTSKELEEVQENMCGTDCVICVDNKVNFQKSSELIKSCWDAKDYNEYVEQYNSKVKKHNSLINDWYKKYYELEKSMFGNIKIVERN